MSADATARSDVILALTTEADAARAEALAQALLEQRLAACVTLTPLTALYRWRGALERSEEVQLLIKTSAERLAPLAATVQRLHSYETPEWISWVGEASPGYGQWVQESCSGDRA
jgi:periplasmic divalent cation tolerance protein